jgi:hypothetical protein
MEIQEHWIAKGELVPPPQREIYAGSGDNARLHKLGHVRVLVSAAGTEVSWAVFAPNWAALYFAMEWLATTPGPYVLKYFLSGWFEESYRHLGEACARIDQIIAKSDLHLVSRVHVKEADPSKTRLSIPHLLQSALNDGRADPDDAIDCIFDDGIDRFRVDRIGPKSAVARLWGDTPSAFPLVSGGAYDQTVSEAYLAVVRSGRPRYDHVYAVMTAPDNSPVWIPYQRVILPNKLKNGVQSVSVISEMAPVEIRII